MNVRESVVVLLTVCMFSHLGRADDDEIHSIGSYHHIVNFINGSWQRYQGSRVAPDDGAEDYTRNTDIRRLILLLFERPFEPLVLPKGPKNTVFSIPDSYWAERYKHLKDDFTDKNKIRKHFGVDVNEIVFIRDLRDRMPDLKVPLSAGFGASRAHVFTHRLPLLTPVIEFFSKCTLEELLSLGCYLRDRYNPYMFISALTIALSHRQDTYNLGLPSMLKIVPHYFITSQTISRSIEEAFLASEESRRPVTMPKEFSVCDDDGQEQKLSYFREDIAVNLHHWNWHFSYVNSGPLRISKRMARRGESFYHKHQQLVARYNFERLSNGVARVLPLDFHEPLKEGYYPKLHGFGGNRTFPGRRCGTRLSDINRMESDHFAIALKTVELWIKRINEAITDGFAITADYETKELDEVDGIDMLGNMVESSILSVNREYYGDLHDMGHMIISLAHDPDNKLHEQAGVMSELGTAVRDPAFFRLHNFVNDIFIKHKHSLPAYQEDQLTLDGVTINSVKVTSEGQSEGNTLYTLWQESEVDISNGLDFTPRGKLVVRFTHLQHRPFTYNIQLTNSGPPKLATCRIFLAPKNDERGQALSFIDQKNVFVEMDKFIVNLAEGYNKIERNSKDSTVTIPLDWLFQGDGGGHLNNASFSGCGYPEHLLVPKGSVNGTQSQLFVMISDYESVKVEDDQVEDPLKMPEGPMKTVDLCALRPNSYRDNRSMGYPFDRKPHDNVKDLTQFLTPNMAVAEVTIKFTDQVLPPRPRTRL